MLTLQLKRLMLIFGCCLLLSVAVNGDNDVPNLPTMPEGEYEISIDEVGAASSSENIQVLTEPVLGGIGEWRVTTGTSFKYSLYRYDDTIDNTDNMYSAIYSGQSYTENNTFSYTIREPGDYCLRVRVRKTTGQESVEDFYFSLIDNGSTETVSARVSEIVQECRSIVSGEYETALWLHDWVINHSYYDGTYCYHGPDSILWYNTGVCDSYSKLYLLLLREAGIENFRVRGGNHAWNAVLIDGVWCMIDTTWDDPTTKEDVIVSGSECHDYFGMNDELLSLDHTYEPTVSCTSLDNYYVKRNGIYKIWLSHIWENIVDAFSQGKIFSSFDTKGRVMTGGGRYYSKEKAAKTVNNKTTIAVTIMDQDVWSFKGGRSVRADFGYDADENLIYYDIPVEGINWILPKDLLEIDESAFEGAEDVYGVVVPESVEHIDAMAFSGCSSLMWVIIEGDEVLIDKNAFSGAADGFVFVCHDGSSASAYAEENEIEWKPLAG